MAYRDDREPLKAAETSLVRELRSLEAREHEIRQALDRTREAMRTRSLPLLPNVRVASPCSADWNQMVGDERVRFCGKCEKNVFNLSAMTSEEAEDLLAKQGASMCARFYRRKDGTMMTSDCPVGVRRKRVRRAVAATVFGGVPLALGWGATTTQATMGSIEPTVGQVQAPDAGHHVMGKMAIATPQPVAPATPTPPRAAK